MNNNVFNQKMDTISLEKFKKEWYFTWSKARILPSPNLSCIECLVVYLKTSNSSLETSSISLARSQSDWIISSQTDLTNTFPNHSSAIDVNLSVLSSPIVCSSDELPFIWFHSFRDQGCCQDTSFSPGKSHKHSCT